MKINFKIEKKVPKTVIHNYGNIDSPYTSDAIGFFADGKPVFLAAGEFHFSRYPHEFWREELLKMRALGLNVVSTYVFWNYHEKEDGTFDFTGDNDVGEFLKICKQISMPCIIRIGPWCHGEVVYGGFPKRIFLMGGKRKDNPEYLAEVRKLYSAIYAEVKDYLDGETVLGVQLENEYTGGIEHMKTLKRMAIEIGFKVPFFTMTGWPYGKPDEDFLPTFGGYPEAPWNHTKKPLKAANRFSITKFKNDMEIGSDLFRTEAAKEDAFDGVPYATCETGAGNQITQHRRPKFGEDDGYGVCFAKFAAGVNFAGYYMFHGGRNRFVGVPMQESRKTFYPNNMNVIDYDFQSPISRHGYFRKNGARLRLLHEFTKSFDADFSRAMPYFPDFVFNGAEDIRAPRCCVRMKKSGEGYFFAAAYDRSFAYPDYPDFEVALKEGKSEFRLPPVNVPSGSMFFYPFRVTLSGKLFQWILAQPVAKIETEGETVYYFTELRGNRPRCFADGKVTELPIDKTVKIGSQGNKIITFKVLSYGKALEFFRFGDKEVFTDATAYADGDKLVFEAEPGASIVVDGQTVALPPVKIPSVSLTQIKPVKLPWDSYLYSHGKRNFYELKINAEEVNAFDDVKLTFDFRGSSVQLFYGETLLDDLFNYDGSYVFCCKQYKKYLDGQKPLVIKVAPAGRFGIGKYYSEIETVPGVAEISLRSVVPVIRKEI